jgi:hypothetical protein
VPVDYRAVRGAKPVLTELILTLRSSDPVEARGVALGWRLFTDACSPIYEPAGSGELDRLWYESLRLLFALRPLPGAKPANPGSNLGEPELSHS